MTQGARVRIGRVKLKGGADLHIYNRPIPRSPVSDELRSWATAVLNCPRAPDAFACVAVVYDPGTKRYLDSSCWSTQHAAFPPAILPSLMEEILRSFMIVGSAEDTVMRNLGYTLIDPEPDGAA